MRVSSARAAAKSPARSRKSTHLSRHNSPHKTPTSTTPLRDAARCEHAPHAKRRHDANECDGGGGAPLPPLRQRRKDAQGAEQLRYRQADKDQRTARCSRPIALNTRAHHASAWKQRLQCAPQRCSARRLPGRPARRRSDPLARACPPRRAAPRRRRDTQPALQRQSHRHAQHHQHHRAPRRPPAQRLPPAASDAESTLSTGLTRCRWNRSHATLASCGWCGCEKWISAVLLSSEKRRSESAQRQRRGTHAFAVPSALPSLRSYAASPHSCTVNRNSASSTDTSFAEAERWKVSPRSQRSG